MGDEGADKKNPQVDFGMVDLAGTDSPELGLQGEAAGQPAGGEAAAKPEAPAAADNLPGQAGPSPYLSAQKSEPEKPSRHPRYEPIEAPSRPLLEPRTVKIILLVVVVLAALAGGVYGVVRWRAAVAAQEQAEKERLDNRSLENLRDQAVRSDGL